MRFPKYNLKSLFLSVFLAASLLGAFVAWRWWMSTQHMRALSNAIAESHTTPETKALLRTLAWSQTAWDTGLIRSLTGPIVMKEVVWNDTLQVDGKEAHIYILDAFVRPIADTPFPPVCVVVDEDGALITWRSVAPFSMGFLDATLTRDGTLTVSTVCNFFYGKGVYLYALKEGSLVPLGEGTFSAFEKSEVRGGLPKMAAPNDAVQKAIDQFGQQTPVLY